MLQECMLKILTISNKMQSSAWENKKNMSLFVPSNEGSESGCISYFSSTPRNRRHWLSEKKAPTLWANVVNWIGWGFFSLQQSRWKVTRPKQKPHGLGGLYVYWAMIVGKKRFSYFASFNWGPESCWGQDFQGNPTHCCSNGLEKNQWFPQECHNIDCEAGRNCVLPMEWYHVIFQSQLLENASSTVQQEAPLDCIWNSVQMHWACATPFIPSTSQYCSHLTFPSMTQWCRKRQGMYPRQHGPPSKWNIAKKKVENNCRNDSTITLRDGQNRKGIKSRCNRLSPRR